MAFRDTAQQIINQGRRKSVCNVDFGLERRDSAVNDMEAHNRPLKSLELIITRRAKAHEKASYIYTYIYVTFAIIATICSVLISTFSSVLLVRTSQQLITANVVISSVGMFINFILTKFALEGRAGRHRERARNYKSLSNKLRYEKLITPIDMWGNLYLEVFRDYSNMEREGNVSIPEFLAPKSDTGGSEGSVTNILPVTPIPLTMAGNRTPSGMHSGITPNGQRLQDLRSDQSQTRHNMKTFTNNMKFPDEETSSIKFLEKMRQLSSSRSSPRQMPRPLRRSSTSFLEVPRVHVHIDNLV
jgi:hypothetical protein